MNYRQLRSDLLSVADTSDRWGAAMLVFFEVADELTRRGTICPDAWNYKAGAFGPPVAPRSFEYRIVCEASDADLQRLGASLNRWTDRLERAGESY